jgi:hypothetical protein
VAKVRIGGGFRTGAASKNGREVVIGTALMLTGENSRTVATAVREKFLQIRNNLPPGIVANVVLDSSIRFSAPPLNRNGLDATNLMHRAIIGVIRTDTEERSHDHAQSRRFVHIVNVAPCTPPF